MKRLMSVLLVLILVLGTVAGLSVSGSAASGTLTVTASGGNSVTVAVGQEIVFTTCLYAGPSAIVNAQGYVTYDASKLSTYAYGAPRSSGGTYYTAYSFPNIEGVSVLSNSGNAGAIYFNFSDSQGVATFNSSGLVFCRYRFKATAAGSATITTTMEYMLNEDEEHVYYASVPSSSINPTLTSTVEAASYVYGDANGDYSVTVADVTTVQKLCAGGSVSYNATAADANGDGSVSLSDAVIVRKYLAGLLSSTSDIGTSHFASNDHY